MCDCEVCADCLARAPHLPSEEAMTDQERIACPECGEYKGHAQGSKDERWESLRSNLKLLGIGWEDWANPVEVIPSAIKCLQSEVVSRESDITLLESTVRDLRTALESKDNESNKRKYYLAIASLEVVP